MRWRNLATALPRRNGCTLSTRSEALPCCSGSFLGYGITSADAALPATLIPGLQLAEPLPLLAGKAHDLHLLDRNVIGRAGVDLDARQHHRQFHVLDGVSLLEDILGCKIVAAGFQHRFE